MKILGSMTIWVVAPFSRDGDVVIHTLTVKETQLISLVSLHFHHLSPSLKLESLNPSLCQAFDSTAKKSEVPPPVGHGWLPSRNWQAGAALLCTHAQHISRCLFLVFLRFSYCAVGCPICPASLALTMSQPVGPPVRPTVLPTVCTSDRRPWDRPPVRPKDRPSDRFPFPPSVCSTVGSRDRASDRHINLFD